MTRRPRQHQLEDESRRQFQQLLPASWIYRAESPDYGVDAHVEIFDLEGNSTGFRFLVQLKATDAPDPKQAQRLRLLRTSAHYLNSQDLPVLIASYHAPTRSFYVRWFHQYDPYKQVTTSATITFDFQDHDLWTPDTPIQLHSDLVLRRTLLTGKLSPPLSFTITFEQELVAGLTKVQLLSAIRRVFDLVPHTFIIEPTPTPNTVVRVTLKSHQVTIDLARHFTGVLHTGEIDHSENHLAADIILLTAILLGKAGYGGLASRIALCVAPSATIIENPSIYLELASILARAQRTQDALILSRDLVQKMGPSWAADVLTIPALANVEAMSQLELEFYLAYLTQRVQLAEQHGDSSLLAIAHYNLGNFSRRRLSPSIAFHHYQRARNLDSSYDNRIYFRTELAGVLFQLERYSTSAKLYETCLTNLERPDVKALFADALMFSGQYSKAHEVFSDYLHESSALDAQWSLKLWVVDYLTATLGVNLQQRHPLAAFGLAGQSDEWSSRGRDLLKEIIELDALCGLAWFNWGVTQNQLGQYETAGVAFTVASVCQQWDLEAWANAWALCSQTESLRKLSALVQITAFRIHRSKFVEECAQRVDEAKRPELNALMHEALEKFSERDSLPIVRFHDSARNHLVCDIDSTDGIRLTKRSIS